MTVEHEGAVPVPEAVVEKLGEEATFQEVPDESTDYTIIDHKLISHFSERVTAKTKAKKPKSVDSALKSYFGAKRV